MEYNNILKIKKIIMEDVCLAFLNNDSDNNNIEQENKINDENNHDLNEPKKEDNYNNNNNDNSFWLNRFFSFHKKENNIKSEKQFENKDKEKTSFESNSIQQKKDVNFIDQQNIKKTH